MNLWIDFALPKRLNFIVTMLSQLQTDPLYSTTTLAPKPPQLAIQDSLRYFDSLKQATPPPSEVPHQRVMVSSKSQSSALELKHSHTQPGRRQSLAFTTTHPPKLGLAPPSIGHGFEDRLSLVNRSKSLAPTVPVANRRTGTLVLQQMMCNEEHQAFNFFLKKLVEKIHCKWKEVETPTISKADPKHQVCIGYCHGDNSPPLPP